MLRSLDALEGLEPAAVAFGSGTETRGHGVWSAIAGRPSRTPPSPAEPPSRLQRARRRPGGAKERERAARASPTRATSFTASLESLKLLAPGARRRRRSASAEARHPRARRRGKRPRESERQAFWRRATSGVAVGLGAGVAERRVAARLRARRAGSLRGQLRGTTVSRCPRGTRSASAAAAGRERRRAERRRAAAACRRRRRCSRRAITRRFAGSRGVARRGRRRCAGTTRPATPHARGRTVCRVRVRGVPPSDELAPRSFRTWVAARTKSSVFRAQGAVATGERWSRPTSACCAPRWAVPRARRREGKQNLFFFFFFSRVHGFDRHRRHAIARKTTNRARRGDESGGRASRSTTTRSCARDEAASIRRVRLQAEYEVEARAMRLRNSQGLREDFLSVTHEVLGAEA